MDKTQNYQTYLKSIEATRFDIAEAIYWYCNWWHGGISSPEYKITGELGFNPGQMAKGPEEVAQYIVRDLLECGVVKVEELYEYYKGLENEYLQ